MTDDEAAEIRPSLVERLRIVAGVCRSTGWTAYEEPATEAADEIERLRGLLRRFIEDESSAKREPEWASRFRAFLEDQP